MPEGCQSARNDEPRLGLWMRPRQPPARTRNAATASRGREKEWSAHAAGDWV